MKIKESRIRVKKKLCICIPTYHREAAVEKFLHDELDLLQKYGVDLYIYDSNENTKTYEIVDAYIQKGFKNLHYKKVDSKVFPSIKVFKIFKAAASSCYEYMWLIHDHTVFREDALAFILDSLKLNHDFYVLNMQADSYGVEEFQDLNDFLLKSAWRLNSYGASILKVQTFLQDINWKEILKKYNTRKSWNYSHIGMYFERASQMEGFKGCQLFFDRKDFLDFQRTEKTSWSSETLRICLECWGNIINSLPDSYNNKIQVLRSQDKWFMSKYSILVYKKNREYGLKEFVKYGKWIRKIYPEDYMRNLQIAIMPYPIAQKIYNHKLYMRVESIKKKKGKVYIFGAGRHGMECAAYLREMEIDYNGFLVSDKEGNPETLDGHQVYQVEEALQRGRSLVLVAVVSSGAEAVTKKISSLNNGQNFIESIII